MKIQVKDEIVNIIDNVDFPTLIKENVERAFLDGRADDPFYVCNLGDVVQKHILWLLKFPRVEVFYAMKCNPTETIVKLLAKLGLGFDCASKTEIAHVLDCGVSPDRIIYANTCKQASHIKYAETHGVKMITFDSLTELHKIKSFHSSASLILRIFVGVTKALCPLGLKFGARIEDVPELLARAIELDLSVIGVSFHVGSGCFDASAYRTAITLSHEAFQIAKNLGLTFSILDLGGGYPGNFDTEEHFTFFHEVCDTINECLDELFPADSGVRIIAEPGRFYASSAFQLACIVSSIRHIRSENSDDEKISYYLNDGVYGSFNCTVFDHYIGEHYCLEDKFTTPLSNETYSSVFWGPTCDNLDKILDNFRIRKLEIGDCVVFRNMGAYTMAAGSNFNGFASPYILYYCSLADWNLLAPLLKDDFASAFLSCDEVVDFISEIESIPVNSISNAPETMDLL